MAKEYIERDEVIERIRFYCLDCESLKRYGDACCDSCGIGDALYIIDDQPAADVVEVRHGEWFDDYYVMFCSECGKQWSYFDNDTQDFKHCPNCGAKMGGERKDLKGERNGDKH